MAMRTKLCSVILTASLLGAAAAASAQDSQDNSYYQPDKPLQQFEIAPFAGFRGGGRFDIRNSNQNIDVDSDNALSLVLGWRISTTEQYELLYSRQETSLESSSPFGPVDLDIQYLHIGGSVITDDERRVQPYITGGLGITRFSPDVPSVSDEEHFSLNVGGGLRVPFNDHFSIRLEARGYVTFVDTNTAIFCVSGNNGGLCNIRGRGNAFFQYDAMLGAAFSF
jgi:opacity protein-like surface antigen